jgi:GxxExxY protein
MSLPEAAPQRPFEGKHADLSGKIIKIFYQVHNELGYGFSEGVYHKALAVALEEAGFQVQSEFAIKVYYHGKLVGEYFADIVVNNLIILELKACEKIIDEHEAQLLSYLKASDLEVGYVLNFGKSAEFKRKVFDNPRKGSLQWTKK